MKKIIALIVLVASVIGCETEEGYLDEFLLNESLYELNLLTQEKVKQEFLTKISVLSDSLCEMNRDSYSEGEIGKTILTFYTYIRSSNDKYFYDHISDTAQQYIKGFPDEYYGVLAQIKKENAEIRDRWKSASKKERYTILPELSQRIKDARLSLKSISDERIKYMRINKNFQFYCDFDEVFGIVYGKEPDYYTNQYNGGKINYGK